jgi:hypothetical protein
MTTTASVAEVQEAGVAIDADEAVAIAQQVVAALRSGEGRETVGPPYGPPTPSTVFLDADGSVHCRASETTPAVSEVAILLQAMLPAQSLRVPGGLRYAIARALLDVDVPPFDSLDDFSETLARYERGPREPMVRRVLQRLDSRRALAPVTAADRRRHPRAAELRRALREADARLYLQKLEAEAVGEAVASRAAHSRSLRPAAAAVAAGLLMILAGELIEGWHRPGRATPTAAIPADRDLSHDVVSHDVALTPDAATAIDGQRTPNDNRDRANEEPRAANGERRTVRDERAASVRRRASRPSVKRASHPVREQPVRVPVRQGSSPGVLERLRLKWLRTMFTNS